MKLIILLLISFNTLAAFKVEMSVNESTQYGQEFIEDTLEDAQKRLAKIADSSSWRKGEWKLSPESSLSKVEKDLDGNDVVYYYYPTNWQFKIEDITAEVAAKEAEDAAKKLRIDELKAKDKNNMKLDELIELLKLQGII